MLIHARHDYISNPHSSEFVFKNLGTKDKDLFILNKAKHSLAEGSRKDFVYTKILNFINSYK